MDLNNAQPRKSICLPMLASNYGENFLSKCSSGGGFLHLPSQSYTSFNSISKNQHNLNGSLFELSKTPRLNRPTLRDSNHHQQQLQSDRKGFDPKSLSQQMLLNRMSSSSHPNLTGLLADGKNCVGYNKGQLKVSGTDNKTKNIKNLKTVNNSDRLPCGGGGQLFIHKNSGTTSTSGGSTANSLTFSSLLEQGLINSSEQCDHSNLKCSLWLEHMERVGGGTCLDGVCAVSNFDT